MDDPWRTNSDQAAGYCEIQAVVEWQIRELAARLNALHHVQRSDRYWRVLLGPWLLFYVTLLVDAWHRFQRARAQLGDVVVVGVDSPGTRPPATSIDFAIQAADDPLNLQVHTRIAEALEFRVERASLGARLPRVDGAMARASTPLRTAAKSVAARLQAAAARAFGGRTDVVFVKALLPTAAELQLFWESRGRVWSYRPPAYQAPDPARPPDPGRRALLRAGDAPDSGVRSVVASLVPEYLPTCFVEDYEHVSTCAARAYGGLAPRAIVSAGEWHFDEGFKFWAAGQMERGATLVGWQHGLNYGVVHNLLLRTHEIDTTDRFLTWGWRGFDGEKEIPVPAPYLADITPCRTSGTKLLYCGTAEPRFRAAAHLNDAASYFERQVALLRGLSGDAASHLVYRPHIQDYGRNLRGMFGTAVTNLRFEGWSLPLRRSLAETKLLIVDCVSTAFAEAVLCGVPSVLLLDPVADRIAEHAQPVMARLEAADILHFTPDAAAACVNRVFADPETWWRESSRQAAIRAFIDNFARTSPTAVTDWLDAVRTL